MVMKSEMESYRLDGAKWANDAFTALSSLDLHSNKQSTFGNYSFTNPPPLFTKSSLEQFGQLTPPKKLSPPPSPKARDTSISIEELINKAFLPGHQPHARQDFQSLQQQEQQEGREISSDDVSLLKKKKLRPRMGDKTGRTFRTPFNASQASATNQMSTDPFTGQAPLDNSQPSKRKRSRAKSQPRLVEAFTADGLSFRISAHL